MAPFRSETIEYVGDSQTALTWSPALPLVSAARNEDALGVPDGLVEGLMNPLPGPAKDPSTLN